MRPSHALFQAAVLRSLWRSLDKLVSTDITPDPVTLGRLASAKDLKSWRVFSDADFGGLSQGSLQWVDHEEPQHARFQGHYNRALGQDSELVRSGYVGISTLLPRPVNLTMHDYLSLRVRSHCPHPFIVSLRTEQYSAASGEEAWQTPLVTQDVGTWEEVHIPLQDFRFTFRGRTASAGGRVLSRIERQRVVGVGFTLAATDDMPDQDDFRLDVAGIQAVAAHLTGEAARAKVESLDLSPEQAAQEEWERQTLETAKRLRTPGSRR